MNDPDPARQTTRSRDVWRTLGIILAVLVAVAGLAMVGLVILFVVAMNSYGSNK